MDYSKIELGDYIIINEGYKHRNEKHLVVHYFKKKIYVMSLENAFFNDLFAIDVPENYVKKMKIKESEFSPTKGFMPSFKGSIQDKGNMTLQKKVQDPAKGKRLPFNEAVGLGYEFGIKVEYNEKYNLLKSEDNEIIKFYDAEKEEKNSRSLRSAHLGYNGYTGTRSGLMLMKPEFGSKDNMRVFDGDLEKAKKDGFKYSFYYTGKPGDLEWAAEKYQRDVLNTWEDEEDGKPVIIFKDWMKFRTNIYLG